MNEQERTRAEDPQIIGYREYVNLPDWGVRGIKAKVDTGARSSAIDVDNLIELGGERVRFDVIRSRRNPQRRVTVEAAITRRTFVRSSFGDRSARLTVRTTIRIGAVDKCIEIGLVSRRPMICRMLLGRSALEGDFLVDSGRTYLYGRKARRRRPGA